MLFSLSVKITLISVNVKQNHMLILFIHENLKQLKKQIKHPTFFDKAFKF